MINAILGSTEPPTPKVGDGATVLYMSDRRAATIQLVSFKRDKTVKWVRVTFDICKALHKDIFTEAQSYEYTSDPNGEGLYFSRRKNGKFVRHGEPMKGGTVLLIGVRDHYIDPHF